MKQKVALVLASGGARGWAHIGAIEELEAQGFEITSIAGASVGALVGGMYAAGNLGIFKDWLLTIDRKKMFSLIDLSIGRNHLVKGVKIMEAFHELAPDSFIEDLSIPYVAVASDLCSGKEVVFNQGSLYSAIRASISIPSVFAPVNMDNKVLVDGGVLNPLPLSRVKRTPGDILVAVNLSAHKDDQLEQYKMKLKSKNKKRGVEFSVEKSHVTILNEISSLMVQQMVELSAQIYKPDLMVNIPMNRYNSFDYDKVAKISNQGKMLMRKALDKYKL